MQDDYSIFVNRFFLASPTQWAWVWVCSGGWWWTGRPCVLQFMGSQRVGHDWATELNWINIHRVSYLHLMWSGPSFYSYCYNYLDNIIWILRVYLACGAWCLELMGTSIISDTVTHFVNAKLPECSRVVWISAYCKWIDRYKLIVAFGK